MRMLAYTTWKSELCPPLVRAECHSRIFFKYRQQHFFIADRDKWIHLPCAAVFLPPSYRVKCIRVHTLALCATNALSSMFRYCCVDTLANVFLKDTLLRELQHPHSPAVRDQLVGFFLVAASAHPSGIFLAHGSVLSVSFVMPRHPKAFCVTTPPPMQISVSCTSIMSSCNTTPSDIPQTVSL